MEALIETTGGQFPAHTYLLDGTTLVAYIKVGTKEPFYFKNGIKNFDKRGRQFQKTASSAFKTKIDTALIEVKGSKGSSYFVNKEEKTCTCPGYTFRGACKHVAEIG
jgi:hypothetical protein